MPNDLAAITLSNGKTLFDIRDAIGVPTVDYKTGAVTEMTIPGVDNGTLLKAGLLQKGSVLTYAGQQWDVAAVEREYKGSSTGLNLTVRSSLARRLRQFDGPKSWSKISPAQWIRTVVKQVGGTAVAQANANAQKIVMKRGENVLTVISSLASDTGVDWCEHGGVVYFGTPWWAYSGGPKLPQWKLALGDAILSASSRSSLDDTQSEAELAVTTSNTVAAKIRPWHTAVVSGLASDDNGLWLVRDVNYELRPGPASLTLYRPFKSSPKKGGTTGGGAGSPNPDVGAPIKGSAFSDGAIPSNWRTRGVNAIMNYYKANRGGIPGMGIYRHCLYYSRMAAGYTGVAATAYSAYCAWSKTPSAKRHSNRQPPPGALLFYRHKNGGPPMCGPGGGDAGHVTVYLGGGKALGTDMPSNNQWSVIDAMAPEKQWGMEYLGWTQD